MTAHFNGRNETETLLCDVTVFLNIGTFLRLCVVLRESFYNNNNNNNNLYSLKRKNTYLKLHDKNTQEN